MDSLVCIYMELDRLLVNTLQFLFRNIGMQDILTDKKVTGLPHIVFFHYHTLAE